MHRYALGFGDTSTSVLGASVSDNNAFVGTQFFAMHKMPWSQFNLWFFQWTVRPGQAAALGF